MASASLKEVRQAIIEDGFWTLQDAAIGKHLDEIVSDGFRITKFECWGRELGSDTQNMISGMTDPDPTARTTTDQVLTHRWWQESN